MADETTPPVEAAPADPAPAAPPADPAPVAPAPAPAPAVAAAPSDPAAEGFVVVSTGRHGVKTYWTGDCFIDNREMAEVYSEARANAVKAGLARKLGGNVRVMGA